MQGEEARVPGSQDTPILGTRGQRDNVALTPYASRKSGEYFQTRFYPFLACPQGHPFLLFSSWSPGGQRYWWVELFHEKALWARRHTAAHASAHSLYEFKGKCFCGFSLFNQDLCRETYKTFMKFWVSLPLAPLRKQKKEENNHLLPCLLPIQALSLKSSELDTSGLERSLNMLINTLDFVKCYHI